MYASEKITYKKLPPQKKSTHYAERNQPTKTKTIKIINIYEFLLLLIYFLKLNILIIFWDIIRIVFIYFFNIIKAFQFI